MTAAYRCTPPSWRGDIEGEADLVEEVLRVKGYDEIPPVPLPRETTISRPAIDPRRRRVELVRRTLAERGLTEAVTFSFLSAKAAALFGGGRPELTLVNPISSDLDVMRPSALPNLVEAARRNADRGFPDVALLELGPLYRDDRPEGQMNVAAGLRAGSSARATGATGRASPISTTRRPMRWRRSPPRARRATICRPKPTRRPGIIRGAPASCGSGRTCSAISASCTRMCSMPAT